MFTEAPPTSSTYCCVFRCQFICTQTGIVSTWRCSCSVVWQRTCSTFLRARTRTANWLSLGLLLTSSCLKTTSLSLVTTSVHSQSRITSLHSLCVTNSVWWMIEKMTSQLSDLRALTFLASYYPCWTDHRQDSVSELLIWTTGELRRRANSPVVSQWTTLWSPVHWPHLLMVAFCAIIQEYTKLNQCQQWSDYTRLVADSNRCCHASSSSQLVIQCARLFTVDDCALLFAGSHLWNSLSLDITSSPTLTVFRNCLKTYLFPDHFLP